MSKASTNSNPIPSQISNCRVTSVDVVRQRIVFTIKLSAPTLGIKLPRAFEIDGTMPEEQRIRLTNVLTIACAHQLDTEVVSDIGDSLSINGVKIVGK
jgi:hypothetical protein